ncbi:MAG: chemotaxis protein CheX [Desulfoprunum sp.]|jgi:chemotaxis protein CheX|uniref:chemotaxis protein CheX n=1 Tax=Desulfoprunum sp. TaxID=2020866 RepID=UPI00068D7423
MITERDIEVFIDGIKHYFRTSTEIDIVVETPYLISADEISVNDYTGIIGISGERKGFVLVTAPTVMLRYLVLSLGEKAVTPDLVHDVIGEVANTISGNARRSFGPGFMISVPLIVQGQPERIGAAKDTNGYVIPSRWNTFPFQLVVSLQ